MRAHIVKEYYANGPKTIWVKCNTCQGQGRVNCTSCTGKRNHLIV